MDRLFKKITIVGVGLIGGSLGMAFIGRQLAGEVVGVDLDQEYLDLAVSSGAVHRGAASPAEGVKDADLVIISTPVGITADIFREIAPHLKPGALVTDVGSTKAKILQAARELLPGGTEFIGGHPMAGSEQAGVAGADRYLFENAVYILTPTKENNPQNVIRLTRLFEAVGARVVEIDAEEHDLAVAGVSHLPHLLAAALVNTAGKLQNEHEKILMLAAGGFRDVTRIASGHPVMWRDICLTNKDKILQVMAVFREVLDELEHDVACCAGDRLEEHFVKARQLRAVMPAKMKGYLPVLHELVVTVPDKPGVLAGITSALADVGINISDIEILRVREGDGGTIRLGFGTQNDQEKAYIVLQSRGISVKKR
ncbi:MAG: prephenate dehydrogenase/arogenate dehydrogenase family protein [Bacillota bacterium]